MFTVLLHLDEVEGYTRQYAQQEVKLAQHLAVLIIYSLHKLDLGGRVRLWGYVHALRLSCSGLLSTGDQKCSSQTSRRWFLRTNFGIWKDMERIYTWISCIEVLGITYKTYTPMAPPKLEDLKEEEKPTPFPPRGDPRWKYSKILLQGVHILFESISSARNPCHPYNNYVWARNPCNVLDAAAPLREHLYSNEWNWKACRFAGSAGMADLSLLIHYRAKFCTFCTLHRRQLDQSGRFLLSHDLEILTTLVISWLRVHNLVSSRFDNMQEKKVWKCYCTTNNDEHYLWGPIWSFMVLFHVHNLLLYSHLDWSPYKSGCSNSLAPLRFSQPANLFHLPRWASLTVSTSLTWPRLTQTGLHYTRKWVRGVQMQ